MEQETSGGSGSKGSGLAPNIAGLLCYLCMPITSIIFLAIEDHDQDVRFHAWQGTLLGLGALVAYIATWIFAAIVGYVIGFLGYMIGLLMYLEAGAVFTVSIICMIKAYQGERWRVPYLGDYAATKAGVYDQQKI